VYRGVDWSFYQQLIDSIPERANIHVDYDGKDLEVTGKGWIHEGDNRLLESSWRSSPRSCKFLARAA